MLSKRYKSTEVDRRTWLHVPSGTPWSTSVYVHELENALRLLFLSLIVKFDLFYLHLSSN